MRFLTLIITVYNIEEYVGDCINSILPQLSDDVELIIVDDGSSDNSSKIINEYLPHPHIKYIYQENKGQSAARNLGLNLSEGEYIWFIDGDDLIESNSIKTIRRYKNSHLLNHDISMFYTKHLNEYGEITNESNKMIDLIKNSPMVFFKNIDFYPAAVWVLVFNRSFLLKNNLLFKEGMVFEDNQFLIRAYNLAENFSSLPYRLYIYRNRKGSTSRSSYNIFKLDSSYKLVKSVSGLKPNRLSKQFINHKLFWYINSYISICFLFEDEIKTPAIQRCFDLIPKISISFNDPIGVIRMKLLYNYNKKRFLKIIEKHNPD